MTPEQLHNNLFLFGSVGAALLIETLGRLWAPSLVAWMAFAPMFSQRIPLGPHTRAELSSPDGQASYRAAALGAVDWSRLSGPRRFDVEGVRFDIDPSLSLITASLPFAPFFFALGGVAALRLRVEGDAIVVGCCAIPWLSLTSAAFFGALIALVARDGPWTIGAFFMVLFIVVNGVAVFRTRRVFAPVVMAGVDAFAERVAR